MLPVNCGHNLPIMIRMYNSGNGQKSIFSLCKICRDKKCFNEFVINEKSTVVQARPSTADKTLRNKRYLS